jgi:hypothetical protein
LGGAFSRARTARRALQAAARLEHPAAKRWSKNEQSAALRLAGDALCGSFACEQPVQKLCHPWAQHMGSGASLAKGRSSPKNIEHSVAMNVVID